MSFSQQLFPLTFVSEIFHIKIRDMKNKFFLASLLMLFSFLLSAQEFDFKIPDIEQETAQPTAYDLAQGNYAGTLLKIDLFEPQIASMLQGHVNFLIIDTGIDSDHPYLREMILREYCRSFVPGQTWEDGNSHGTHVAGCAVGYSPNIRLGTAQLLAKHNKASIVVAKGLQNNGYGNYDWVRSGVNYFRELAPKLDGFDIIIMSLGGSADYKALEDVIEAARSEGIMVIVAAGNTGGTPVQFPGRSKGADAIAATNDQLKRDYYSSYGKEVMFAGPGTQILSSVPGGGTGKKTGTSMAAPTVAGTFGLLASMHPGATANQLEQLVAKNAMDILPDGRDELTGFGAPVFGLWIFSDPTQLPDEPVGWMEDSPEDPELHREKRTLVFDFRDLEIWWKNASDAKLDKLHFDVTISMTTTLYDETAYDNILDAVEWYVTNRAVVVSDQHGFKDATHYAGGHFLEGLIKDKYDFEIKVDHVEGIDEAGRICHVNGEDIHSWMLPKSLKRLKVGVASTFVFKS
jgi:subtilisin family serine protease